MMMTRRSKLTPDGVHARTPQKSEIELQQCGEAVVGIQPQKSFVPPRQSPSKDGSPGSKEIAEMGADLLAAAIDGISSVELPKVEVTVDAVVDANKDVAFGQAPVECRCVHCKKGVISFVEFEASWLSWTLAFVLVLLFGWFSLLIVPLLWPILKDVVHRCPSCLNVLRRRRRIQLPEGDKEVVTVEIGSMAVVLSKTYALAGLALMFIVFMFCCLRTGVSISFHTLEVAQGRLLNETLLPGGRVADPEQVWRAYLEDCGGRRSFTNPVGVHKRFEDKWHHNDVELIGEVMGVMQGGTSWGLWHDPSAVAIRMVPELNQQFADVMGFFNEELDDAVAELERGDRLKFRGTMLSPGGRGASLNLKLWTVEKLPPLPAEDDMLPPGLMQMLMGGFGGAGGGMIGSPMFGGLPGMPGGMRVVRVVRPPQFESQDEQPSSSQQQAQAADADAVGRRVVQAEDANGNPIVENQTGEQNPAASTQADNNKNADADGEWESCEGAECDEPGYEVEDVVPAASAA